MTKILITILSIACLVFLVGCATKDYQVRLQSIERKLQQQEDIEAIRRVAYSYGYFMDNALIDSVVALFADDMEYCEISGYGLYRNRTGCEVIWQKIIGPALQNNDGQHRYGLLVKHYLVKDIITVSPDGNSAEGRFDYIGFSGALNVPDRALNQLGVYRMGFVKDNGVWKINRFNLSFDTSDFNDNNWTSAPGIRCPRDNVPQPDAAHIFYHPFPESGTVPFHYPHPVTGEEIPAPVNPRRYWQGNGKQEFWDECGKREDALETIERDIPITVRTER